MIFPEVIQQSVAPAFLLGAVGSFVTVLNLRSERIIDQRNAISATDPDPLLLGRRRALTRRAQLLLSAILLALLSAAAAATLIVVSFLYAFFNATEERGLALMFTVSLGFLGFSVVQFGREVFAARRQLGD